MPKVLSTILHPSQRARSIVSETAHYIEQIQKAERGEIPWSSVQLSKDQQLKRVEIVILRIINFFLKFFKKNFISIDRTFEADGEFKKVLNLQHKFKKINLSTIAFKSPFVVTAEKINIAATRSRLSSLKAQASKEHLEKLQHSVELRDTALMTEKYDSLPKKLRKILANIAEMQEGHGKKQSGQRRHELMQMVHKLYTLYDDRGNNVFTQLEQMLVKKQQLCWDLSVLNIVEHRLHRGASYADVQADLNSLSAPSRALLKLDEPGLSAEQLAKRLTDALFSIQENSLKSIDEAFRDLLNKVHHDLSIYEVSSERLTSEIPKEILTKPITVTMVGVEFAGFVKEGGLAEALEGLAKGMKQQHLDNKVRLIFPKFSLLPAEIQKKLAAVEPQHYIDNRGNSFPVYKLEIDGIECHFIDHPSFQIIGEKPSVYGPENDAEAPAKRFSAFSGLAADLIQQLSPTDVIHLHDWHVAGVALRLQRDNPDNWKAKKVPPIVFTYHNNNRVSQGRLGQGVYNYNPVIQGLIQAGIATKQTNIFVETIQMADAVTTVSESFGIESQQAERGEGVSFAIREAAESGKLTGVINGSNPDRWNPEKDPQLKGWKDIDTGEPLNLTFGPASDNIVEQKEKAKQQLQKWVKRYMPAAPIDFSKPIVTYIGRFDSYQKGLDKMEEGIDATLKSGGQFICMGILEDKEATKILDRLQKKYKKGVLFIRDYRDPNGRLHFQQGDDKRPGIGSLVRAATDHLFIPSRYEPCGLVQFEGWLFGTLALGSRTGGLADTIISPDTYGKQFNGFIFDREGNPQTSISKTIPQAINLWNSYSKDQKKQVMQRLITDARKFSWTTSPSGFSPVEKYRFVYENARRLAETRRARSEPFNRRFNLSAYLSKIRTPNLIPKAPPIDKGVALEETYLRLYHSSDKDSQKLDKVYRALPEGLRSQVPSPYGKNIDYQAYQKFGAHPQGNLTRFAVSAPNAKTVSLYAITPRGHVTRPMARQPDGSWTIEVNDAPIGTKYQYIVNDQAKIDPFGLQHTTANSTRETPFSIVSEREGHKWEDSEWLNQRLAQAGSSKPISVYELHPTSWKKKDGRYLNYRELADELIAHCQKVGYTHVELMGILEHPSEASWGYQVSGFFAPNSRLGTPDDFKYLVDKLHKHKIGVVLDWIPAHFATDDYSLSSFDSTKQYESTKFSILIALRHIFLNWGTKFFDYRKKHVREFLISSAAYWFKEMHIDGIRVDAIRAILMNEPKTSHLFLKDLNAVIHQQFPGALTIAEDYSGSGDLTQGAAVGGLGFDLKWHVGWMKRTLDFFTKPIERRPKHYSQLIAAIENDTFHKQLMALSHDEMGHEMRNLIDKTPSLEEKDKFSNLRLMLSFMMCLPGKKLMFMGSEFGSTKDWATFIGQQEGFMDSQLIQEKGQQAMQCLSAFNELYKENKAFWEHDDNGHDLEWIERNDPNKQVIAYRRTSSEGQSFACLHNFSNNAVQEFVVPLPDRVAQNIELGFGPITEVINTDDKTFGGEGKTNPQIVGIRNDAGDLIAYKVTIPPLTTLVIKERS